MMPDQVLPTTSLMQRTHAVHIILSGMSIELSMVWLTSDQVRLRQLPDIERSEECLESVHIIHTRRDIQEEGC